MIGLTVSLIMLCLLNDMVEMCFLKLSIQPLEVSCGIDNKMLLPSVLII